MSNRFSFTNISRTGKIPTRRPPDLSTGPDKDGVQSSDDEDSSSDISDNEIREIASKALAEGMAEGKKGGQRTNTSFIETMTCTQRWGSLAWESAKFIVPLSFAGGTLYMTSAAELPVTAFALATGATAAFVHQAFSGRFGREQFKDGLRIAFTQLTSQFGSAIVLRFGFEQLALSADPTLSEMGYFNGTHYEAFVDNATSTLSGNRTEVYAIDHERVFPGGTAWMSLALLSLPVAVYFHGFLSQPRHATTALDSLTDRFRFDASKGPGRVVARWSDNTDKWVKRGVKTGVTFTGVFVVGGLLFSGNRKLALRILSNAILVQSAARARDFANMVMRGVSPGSPASESWPDSGLRRQQQIKIPASVMEALEKACTDPSTGRINQEKRKRVEQFLRFGYRDLFIGGRASSLPIYGVAGVFGLFIMRDFFSPSIGGVFADSILEAISVAIPFSLGTAFTEGVEEPGWAYMVSIWAGAKGMPMEIARAPTNPREKMSENLAQLSFTALLPGNQFIRGVFPSTYSESKVQNDGTVALSHADRIELNAGIRAGQNLATMIILTAAGASADPTQKTMLFSVGVVLNACTHFRGNVVAQILESGREARLLYEHQDDIRRATQPSGSSHVSLTEVPPESSGDDDSGSVRIDVAGLQDQDQVSTSHSSPTEETSKGDEGSSPTASKHDPAALSLR